MPDKSETRCSPVRRERLVVVLAAVLAASCAVSFGCWRRSQQGNAAKPGVAAPVGSETPAKEEIPKPLVIPEGPGKIAFVSNRGGQPDIYVMEADGSNVRRVTNDPDPEQCLTWSPDGKQIAFNSERGYERTSRREPYRGQIWVINADGSNPRQITHGEENSRWPGWSPEGTKIAFTRANTIWVMNADGSDARPLLRPDPRFRRSEPGWSPDGKKIVFTSDEGNPTPTAKRPWRELWIWTINADGSNPRRIDQAFHATSPDMSYPSWSPDGTTIAFSDHSPYLVSPDGSNQRAFLPPASPRSDHLGVGAGLAWSPDGSRVAFSAAPVTYEANPKAPGGVQSHTGQSDIYVANADGSDVKNLTNDPANDRDPAWSLR